MTDLHFPVDRGQPDVRGGKPIRRAVLAGLLTGLAVLLAGCGSGGLPTSLPSISIPDLPTRPAPTATVTVTRAAATVTVTDKTTVTATRTQTATTTVTHTATATRTAEPSPTCQGADCSNASSGNQGIGWFWGLLLLVAAVAAGVVAWRAVRGRQEWDRRFGQACAELEWTESELVPRVLSAPTTDAAATQWEAGRTRVQLAAEELRSLSGSAVNQGRSDKVTALSRALAGLIGALDANSALNPEADADTVRGALVAVQNAQRSLRQALNAGSQG